MEGTSQGSEQQYTSTANAIRCQNKPSGFWNYRSYWLKNFDDRPQRGMTAKFTNPFMPWVEYNLQDEKELPTHRDLHLDQSMDRKCDLQNTKPIVAAVTIEMFSLSI